MLDYTLQVLPILILLIAYFIRLEIRLAKVTQDICWIKKYIGTCQQHLEKSTQ